MRLITDTGGNIVWRWDNTEPFGNNMPNQNPSGQGTFEFPLRFPGQYFDIETGLFQNYFRDYDPSRGGYPEADPIGLAGGSLSPYVYVGGNPISRFDPLGLCANSSNPSQDCLNALRAAGADRGALSRVNDSWGVIQGAAEANGIDPNLLASIAIRETGFRNIAQYGHGLGRGVFQIDLGQNPAVTEAQAYDVGYSANFAANMLATNMSTLATNHPDLTPNQLLQATAASYNLGVGGISGNPNTIDVGSPGNNYGSNVLSLIFNCFK